MKQFSLFFVCFGIVLLVFSLVSRARRRTERKRFYQTLGTIIDKHTENIVDDSAMPTSLTLLTVRFVTTLGQISEFVVQSPVGDQLEVNDEIRVFYDAAHPELATLSLAPTGSNLLAISSTVGGTLCLLVGLFFLVAS